MQKIYEKICKILREMFTETDNMTSDLAAFLFALVIIVYVACGAYTVFHLGQPLDWQGAGVGVGAILSAAGIMFACKKPSTPASTGSDQSSQE